MKAQLVLLRIAGVISLIFLIFHCTFYSLFKWESGLSCLSIDNRAIMLTYHSISILILGFMALIPIIQTKALLVSPLKYAILGMFSLFYLIRIITEYTLFGFAWTSSPIILLMCTLPMTFYAVPIFWKIK